MLDFTLTGRDWQAKCPLESHRCLKELTERYGIDDPVWEHVCSKMRFVTFPRGTELAKKTDPLLGYLILTQGAVRLEVLSPLGRKLVVSRIEAGESCLVCAVALLSNSPLAADAIADSEIWGGYISRADFRRCLAESPGFGQYIFSSWSDQLNKIMRSLREVVFNRVDVRLAKLLLSQMDSESVVVATHEDLAAEIGTAREVISRNIKSFKISGWVEVERGRMRVLDRDSLLEIAFQSDSEWF